MRQQTDELLFSSIRLLLAAPVDLMELTFLVPALTKAIDIGRVHPPAADLGMTILERWSQENPRALQPYLPSILPHLQHFLLPQQQVDSVNTTKKEVKATPKTSSAAIKGVAKTSTALYRRRAEMLNTMRPHKTLVTRIMEYLGSLGGDGLGMLASPQQGSSSSRADVSLKWDTKASIKYAMPFPNDKLNLELDVLVPRTLYLAELSSDRKLRVSACESLHALIVYTVMRRSTDPNRDKPGKAAHTPAEHYKHIFPVILRLATGPEPVANQLFQPLVKQLIHWFTDNNFWGTPECQFECWINGTMGMEMQVL